MRLAAAAILLALAAHAHAASPVLDRIRANGAVRCASAIRPGLAFPAIDHTWHGLHVGLCRALAAAVLGDPDRIEFHGDVLRQDFDRLPGGADDVAFLTGSEMFAHELFGRIQPGPVVFMQSTRIMVWDANRARHVADLGPAMVCEEPGSGADRMLTAYARAHGWTLNASGWMELEEMMDAFNAGRCPAVAGEATALAALRLQSAQAGHPSRLLPEPIALTPVLAATPLADPGWSAIVAWTIETVMAGPAALPIDGGWLGLDTGWQSRAVAGGGYDQLYRASLGADSPLEQAPEANAGWGEGGLMAPPTVE